MWITKPKGKPHCQVRFDHPDGSGRVVCRSTGCEGRRAALEAGRQIVDAFIAAWKREQGGGDVTAQHVISEYWDTELSKRKWAASAFVHLDRISKFLGDRRYCDVTISDVAAFVDAMAKESGISDSTINRALAVWHRMHNVAGETREYPVQRIAWSKLFRDEPEGRDRAISSEEIRKLLRAAPPHMQEIIAFALATGARRSQILTLTWERVDIDAGTATIFRKHRKKNAPHRIELNDTALAAVRRREAHALTTGPIDPAALVFDTTNFQHLWERAVEAAGLEDFRFHDLRHTFATAAARHTALTIVAKQLGHSTTRMTERYAHVQQGDVRDAVRRLPKIDLDGGDR